MKEKAIRQYWILVRRDEEGLRQAPHWSIEKWVSVLENG